MNKNSKQVILKDSNKKTHYFENGERKELHINFIFVVQAACPLYNQIENQMTLKNQSNPAK
jgi:hypothetical protein